MKRLAQTCGPAIKDVGTDDPGAPERPNLTVQPPDPTLNGAPPPPPPAPEPVVIDAAVPPPTPEPSGPTADERAGGGTPDQPVEGQPMPPGEALAPGDRAPGTDDGAQHTP